MMPMICFTGMAAIAGLRENVLTIRIPMEPAARFPVLLPSTLSSAIASNLAKGYDLDTAVEQAKAYISGALAAMLDLGKGSGPMDHGFAITGEYKKESERE